MVKATKTKSSKCEVAQTDCLALGTDKFWQLHSAARLAILDPPYNMGKAYDSYHDEKSVVEYLMWFTQRLAAVRKCLVKTGAIWVFINDGLVSEVDLQCKAAGLFKRNHIVWYYTFGQHHNGNFTASHTHLLYYTGQKGKRTWNPDAIRVPSARQIKYKDKRADPRGRVPDNTWVLFPEQLPQGWDPLGDTWLFSRVCGTFHEREPHSPNQIPVPLMERIILATSDPGDLVLDPFCGAGSAGVACKRTGRDYFGTDISKTCVRKTKERLARD